MHQGKPPSCAPGSCFWAVLSLDVSTQTVFLYYMSVKYTLKRNFLCFWCPCCASAVMSNRWNQYAFNPSYMGAQVNTSAIAHIYWLIQTFKYQSFGFQVYFKTILVYNLKTKSGFWSKCQRYMMGYITNLSSIFSYFHCFWIWHIWIIHCANFEVYTCSICDVVTIPINACSSLFNRLRCCQTFWWVYILYKTTEMRSSRGLHSWSAAVFFVRRCMVKSQ